MKRKVISAIIAASMLLTTGVLGGCTVKASDGDSEVSSVSEPSVSSETSEASEASSSEASSSTESNTSSESASSKAKNTSSAKDKNSASSKKTESKKTESKSTTSKSTTSKSTTSKTTASKTASKSESTSSNSSSSNTSSKTQSNGELTYDEALEIVLKNTDFTEDELIGIATNKEDGEKFHNVSFYRNNGSYVFYVRDKDKKFFTYEEFNEAYNEDYNKDETGKDRAIEVALENTMFTEDELTSIIETNDFGEDFYALTFYRDRTFVFYVRQSDYAFYTYDEYNKEYNDYYVSTDDDGAAVNEEEALEIVLNSTDYYEYELLGVETNVSDGDMFYNIAFYRNGTYVFYVRQRDGRLYDSEEFNQAYNEYYEDYVGHD